MLKIYYQIAIGLKVSKIKKSYPNKIIIILNELLPVAFYSNQGNNYLINSEYINSNKIYIKKIIDLLKSQEIIIVLN